jgi:hypothetical protein
VNQQAFARSYLRLRALRPEDAGSVAISIVKTLGFREVLNEASDNHAAHCDCRRIAQRLYCGF